MPMPIRLDARAADFPLAGSKISLKDGSSPSKRRVTFQARFAGDLGGEERLRGRKRLHCKTRLFEQVGQRLTHRVAVVDNRHQ